MNVFDARSVERPRFFNGQQLSASDLDGIAAFQREMQWEHNRSLHQPGVGNGLAVSGRRGDREVRVQPGYALDVDGREILLLQTQVEPVPPVASELDGGPVFFDLTASYPSDDDLEVAETREGVCLPRGVVRLREQPIFCWVRLRHDLSGRLLPARDQDALDIQGARKIVLARAQVRECALDADISITQRRSARPAQPPHIACGCSPVEWTGWSDPITRDAIGILAKLVDTTSGRFRVTPSYSARVAGERPLIANAGGFESYRVLPLLDLPAYVIKPSAAGFECRVPLLALRAHIDDQVLGAIVEAAQAIWPCVTWLGVEG